MYPIDVKKKPRKECGMFYSRNDAPKVCPEGWRLANKDDFIQLAASYGIGLGETEDDESEDTSSVAFENLARYLYADSGLNLLNCGMVVAQMDDGICNNGFCTQQFGEYGGFWGESFDVGIVEETSVVLDYGVDPEYRFDGLLPVRCIYDEASTSVIKEDESECECGDDPNCDYETQCGAKDLKNNSQSSYNTSSSNFKISNEVYQVIGVAFVILILVTFILGVSNKKVVFFNVADFVLSLCSFICLVCSSTAKDYPDYSWAEIPLLILGIVLFMRIILTCILDNRSILWEILISPLKVIVSIAVILYPFLWLMEKSNKHSSFNYSESDSRTYWKQKSDFESSKKIWAVILLALLGLLIWIVKKCLNGQSVYDKNGWEKDDGWNFKMLFGKRSSENENSSLTE